MATIKVNMHQIPKHLRSTKQQYQAPNKEYPIKPLPNYTNIFFAKVLELKRKIATYLTGNVFVTPNRETNNYFTSITMTVITY